GFAETAQLYRERVARHRMENPYYRYVLANEAFAAGDYQTAVSHLEYAIDRRADEDRFLALMSMSQLMLGNRDASEKWMRRAEAAASKDADKRRYHNKLDLLLRQDPDSG
ncbi:MAG TPA: tetratricopeptide repeat protein, partial [Xanthomonadales bacterium]|nr:tetratricopeptide repeat protein [Xanthomonadales bacterium]